MLCDRDVDSMLGEVEVIMFLPGTLLMISTGRVVVTVGLFSHRPPCAYIPA